MTGWSLSSLYNNATSTAAAYYQKAQASAKTAIAASQKSLAALEEASQLVEAHAGAITVGLTAAAIVLAPPQYKIVMLAGCAGPQAGPCGCPSIVDKDGDPVDPELEDAICNALEKAESDYPPLTCNVDEIVVAPNIKENCGEWGKVADGCFALSLNTVYLKSDEITTSLVSPFSSERSLASFSQQMLIHEVAHSRQEFAENRDDFGYRTFQDEICSQTDYVGMDTYINNPSSLEYDPARLSYYSLAECDEDHAETLSFAYVYPQIALASSHPDFIRRVSFAESQWGIDTSPPQYPYAMDATYVPAAPLPTQSMYGAFIPIQNTFAYVEAPDDRCFINYGTVDCTITINPYDPTTQTFPASPEEVYLQYPLENIYEISEGFGTGDFPFDASTASIADDVMTSVYDNAGTPILIISDLTTGEYLETEIELPPVYDGNNLGTTIYQNQVIVFGTSIDLSQYDPRDGLTFPRYDLHTGEQLPPLSITEDLSPLYDNGYDSLWLSPAPRTTDNPFWLIRYNSNYDGPLNFDGYYVFNLNPGQETVISTELHVDEESYSTLTPNGSHFYRVSSAGDITRFVQAEITDYYTGESYYQIDRKPLGQDHWLNINYKMPRSFEDWFAVDSSMYFLTSRQSSEDSQISNVEILSLTTEEEE